MDWFESQIHRLQQLTEEYIELKQQYVNVEGRYNREWNVRRKELTDALDSLVEEVASRPDISACLVSYDGLVLSMGGSASDFDALAAVVQECQQSASKGAGVLSLGEIEQMVIIGSKSKIAVVALRGMSLCILSPRTTILSSSLRVKG